MKEREPYTSQFLSWPGLAGYGGLRRIIGALFCLAFFLQPCAASIANPQIRAQEYELKAIYCYNFLNFVHWPLERANQRGGGSFKIMVLGKAPEFTASLIALQKHLADTGKDHIVITQVAAYSDKIDFNTDHLLYISPSETSNLQVILNRVKNLPVLTVGDAPGFLEAGGMINLIVSEGTKVRWEVNQTALDQAGLKMSAKVLQIAVRVVGTPLDPRSRTEGLSR